MAVITLYDEPRPNEERRCIEVGETETHLIDVLPMLYNHRVVLTPRSCPLVWDRAWCYPDLLTALAALRLWQAEGGDEPRFWIKDPTPPRQRHYHEMGWEDPRVLPLTETRQEGAA